MLAGHDMDSILDALVFSGLRLPIDRVMVGGEWRVHDGVHVANSRVNGDFIEVGSRPVVSIGRFDMTSPTRPYQTKEY